MAEEEKQDGPESSENPAKPLLPSLSYEPFVPDVYSNNSEIIIGGNDVAIAFLHDIGFNTSQKANVRVVMPHAVFLNFAAYCNTRAKFIQDAYGNSLPSLEANGRSEAEIQQSFDDMMSKRKVVARFEFDD